MFDCREENAVACGLREQFLDWPQYATDGGCEWLGALGGGNILGVVRQAPVPVFKLPREVPTS
jgi:hypothetical protein